MVLGRWEYKPEQGGALEVNVVGPNVAEVYFVPPEWSLLEYERVNDESSLEDVDSYKAKLLDINGKDNFLTIHPIVTFGNKPNFLKPKYSRIERITLTDIFVFSEFDRTTPTKPENVLEILEENLTSMFVKNYAFGLGFAKPYRFIVDAVEELSNPRIKEIFITSEEATGPYPNDVQRFCISTRDIDKTRRELDKIDRHTQTANRTVKGTLAYNILAERLGLPTRDPKEGRHPFRKFFTAAAQGKKELSEKDQSAVIDALRNNAASIAENWPKQLAKLRGDIEVVTLETLIRRYEGMLDQKLPERHWQDFFNENPFILNMAFGYPVIKVQDQASVGGRKLSRSGEKIADFLVKNSLTNNTAIFEIKTPQTAILNKKEYREGVFTPSSYLSGSINQALDQKYKFQKDIAQLKENTRRHDLESYAVHCCLVIGKTPDSDDQKKSFELFRHNSKDVEIVTFDEILEKLKILNNFLRPERKP